MLEQRQQRNVADLHDLELHSGNISHGLSFSSLSGNKDFIVDLHKVQAAVPRDKGSDLLGVLDQLDTGAFTNSRVRLLRFNTTNRLAKGRKKKERKRKCSNQIFYLASRIHSTR